MDRRTFCKSSTVAIAAGALSTLHADSETKPVKSPNRGRIYKAVKLSRSTTREHLENLRALGFDGVEPQAPGYQDPQGLVQMCKSIGLRVHGVVDSVHWKDRLSSPDESIRAKGINGLENAIRTASEVGAGSVLLVPGRVTGEDETHEHVWKRSIDGIRAVLPLAGKLDIRILVETVWNGFCETPELFRDYLDEIGSPWVGAYYDIGNMQKFRASHEWIRILGNRVIKMDAKDWGEKNGFCRLGEGDVDWKGIRTELDKIGFTGWVTREGKDNDLEDTAKLMNELLGL
jgi:L-ribulose-5-phosphate 3-epimerase